MRKKFVCVPGAADFLPDLIPDSSSTSPKYTEFPSIVVKVNAWLEKVKVSSVCLVQVLYVSICMRDT